MSGASAAASLVLTLGVFSPFVGRAAETGYAGGPGSDRSVTFTYRAVYHAYRVRLFPDRGPRGERIDLFRNVDPLYQTLDGAAYGLGPSGGIDTVLSVRYVTDFGTGFHRDTVLGAGIPAVDGRNDFDLLMLYADWRGAVPERLDLRVGRQLLLDDLDWYGLDGLKLTFHAVKSSSVRQFDLEAYAGVPVRFGILFSSEPFIEDGYEISDGPGFGFGGAVSARLLGTLALSAAYRQELTIRGSDIDIFRPPPTTAIEASEIEAIRRASAGRVGLAQSSIGGSVGYTIRPIAIDVYAHAIWNLVFGKPDLLRGGIAFNPARTLHLQAEVLESWPRFAGDSIFNVFNSFPYVRARGEASVEILPGLLAEAGYFLLDARGGPKGPLSRTDPGGEGAEFQGSDLSHGPSAGLSFRRAAYGLGVFFEAGTNTGGQYAFGGNYRRGEIFGDFSFAEDRFGGVLRVEMTTLQNDWFQEVDAGQVANPETSYALEIGGRARIIDSISARVNVVKNFGSLLEGSYRVLSILEVRY